MKSEVNIAELETRRLLLRQWKEKDLPAFADLNSDPDVMAYFPKCLSLKESNILAEKCKNLIAENGWGFWALELKETREFIGFVGLHRPSLDFPCSPCVEIGWRLGKAFWKKGYAIEAAQEALRYAFMTLGLKQVVSFTTVSNLRSRAVMENLGFTNVHENFEHPDLVKGHALSEHVLYKLKA